MAVAPGAVAAEAQFAIARRPLVLRVNLEIILYTVIAVMAGLTRFWDLSSRAEHHDESLHAYFSWLFYVGDGYVHDPLMHGPTLFHTNAFAYLLFGDNDYTSRLWPALLGVILVLMPFMLRGPQLLGRWGALTCSVLLLFSPSLLYQSRYIRHDPLVLVMTMAIVIAALRYLERPERKWVVTVAVMAGLLFATTAFLACGGAPDRSGPAGDAQPATQVELLNVSYDPTRELHSSSRLRSRVIGWQRRIRPSPSASHTAAPARRRDRSSTGSKPTW